MYRYHDHCPPPEANLTTITMIITIIITITITTIPSSSSQTSPTIIFISSSHPHHHLHLIIPSSPSSSSHHPIITIITITIIFIPSSSSSQTSPSSSSHHHHHLHPIVFIPSSTSSSSHHHHHHHPIIIFIPSSPSSSSHHHHLTSITTPIITLSSSPPSPLPPSLSSWLVSCRFQQVIYKLTYHVSKINQFRRCLEEANSQRQKWSTSCQGLGEEGMGSLCLIGTEFPWWRWKSSGDGWWGWLHHTMNVFSASELCTYKGLTWKCCVMYISPQLKHTHRTHTHTHTHRAGFSLNPCFLAICGEESCLHTSAPEPQCLIAGCLVHAYFTLFVFFPKPLEFIFCLNPPPLFTSQEATFWRKTTDVTFPGWSAFVWNWVEASLSWCSAALARQTPRAQKARVHHGVVR